MKDTEVIFFDKLNQIIAAYLDKLRKEKEDGCY